jgi:hypothetical protein
VGAAPDAGAELAGPPEPAAADEAGKPGVPGVVALARRGCWLATAWVTMTSPAVLATASATVAVRTRRSPSRRVVIAIARRGLVTRPPCGPDLTST